MGSFDRSNDERKDSFPGYKGAGMPKPPVPPPPSTPKPAGASSWSATPSKGGSESKSDDGSWRWNKYGSGSGSSGASSSGSWKWNKYDSSGSGSTGEPVSAGFVRPSESKSTSGKFSRVDSADKNAASSSIGSKGSAGSSASSSSSSGSAAKEEETPWRWNKYASLGSGSSSPSDGSWKWNKYTSSWSNTSKDAAASATSGTSSAPKSSSASNALAGSASTIGASSAGASKSGWGSGFHSGSSKSGSHDDATSKASGASESDKAAFSWGSGFHGGSHGGTSTGSSDVSKTDRPATSWRSSAGSSSTDDAASKGMRIGDITYGAHTKSSVDGAAKEPKADKRDEDSWRWNKYGSAKDDASAKQDDSSWRWNKYGRGSSGESAAAKPSGDDATSSSPAMASKDAAEKRSERPWGWAKEKNLRGASTIAGASAAGALDGAKAGSDKVAGVKPEGESKAEKPAASTSASGGAGKDAASKREESSWHKYTPSSPPSDSTTSASSRAGAHSSSSMKADGKLTDKPADGKEASEEGSLREEFERRYDEMFGRAPSSSSRAKGAKDSPWYASSADGKAGSGEAGSVPAEDFYKPSKYFNHKDYLDPNKKAESASSGYSPTGSRYSATRRGMRAEEQRTDSNAPRSSQDGQASRGYGSGAAYTSGEDYTSHAGASSRGVSSDMYGARPSYSSRYEAANHQGSAQASQQVPAGAAAASVSSASSQGAQQPSPASVTSPQARQKPQATPQMTPAQAARQRVATQQSQAAAQAATSQGTGASQQASGQEPPSRSEVSTYDTSFYGTKSFKRPRKNHKRRNIILGVVGVLIVAVAVYGFALYTQVKDAKADASVMMSQGKTLVDQLKTGDKSAATQTALDLTDTAQKLNGTVNGPLWAPATLIPVYGSDVAQVRTIAGVADTLCTQVLMPLVNAMPPGGMSEFFQDGSINVDAIENVLTPLAEESDTIQACADQVNGMGEMHLAQLQEPIEKVSGLIDQLGTLSEFAGELSGVLPAMLGADEPRYYLLAAMNNSELRSGGGMVGSVGVMTVTDGKLEIGDFMPASSLTRPEDGYMPVSLTDEEVRIFNTRIGTDIRDTALMPDFPRAAEIEKGLWEYSGNQSVSGVIAIDPVFLQRLLALTGSVTTSDGTVVDGNNAGEMLMYEVYLKYRDQNDVQDAFFAEVAHAAFANIFGNLGDVDFSKFIKLVTTSFKDRRINVWMANPEEEAVILELGAAGDISRSETAPATGIFFGGASGGKTFWFLDVDTQVSEGSRNADGSMSYDITVTFRNTLTDDVAEGLPHYFWGDINVAKQSKAQMDLFVYLFAPGGGSIANMVTEGYFFQGGYEGDGWYLGLGDAPMIQTTYNGSEVWYGVARVEPGSTSTITYTVTTSPKAAQALEVDVTPIANENL